MYAPVVRQRFTANVVIGLLGNESPDSNRFTPVTPKSENDVRLQATLGNQNPTSLPVGAVRRKNEMLDISTAVIIAFISLVSAIACSFTNNKNFYRLAISFLTILTALNIGAIILFYQNYRIKDVTEHEYEVVDSDEYPTGSIAVSDGNGNILKAEINWESTELEEGIADKFEEITRYHTWWIFREEDSDIKYKLTLTKETKEKADGSKEENNNEKEDEQALPSPTVAIKDNPTQERSAIDADHPYYRRTETKKEINGKEVVLIAETLYDCPTDPEGANIECIKIKIDAKTGSPKGDYDEDERDYVKDKCFSLITDKKTGEKYYKLAKITATSEDVQPYCIAVPHGIFNDIVNEWARTH